MVGSRRKQGERSAAAKHLLLEAAIVLIARHGFDGFSIDKLVTQAGVSRGLPRHHFRTKDGLLLEVAKKVVVAPAPPHSPSETALIALLREVLSTARPTAALAAFVAFITAPLLPGAVSTHVQRWWEDMEFVIHCHLVAAAAERGVRRSYDLRTGAKALTGALAGQLVLGSKMELPDAHVSTFIALCRAGWSEGSRKPKDKAQERGPTQGQLI
jgi:AcrR family transcriptional regulator